MRILEVCHEYLCAAVKPVDDHFSINRTGNFNPTILKVGRNRSDFPFAFANVSGFHQKIGELASIELHLSVGSCRKKFAAAGFKRAMKIGKKSGGFGREDFLG